MTKIIKTKEDGWECAPAIMEIGSLLPEARDINYEIQHCKRGQRVEDMLNDLKDFVTDLKQRIDDAVEVLEGVEFETVEDED
jgi:hypothetical protein